MRSGAAILAAAAFAAGGCGFGPGDESEGEATLTVTRAYGSETMVEAIQEGPPESETVIRFLDREAEIATRYGGGFVQSIEDVSGEVRGGRRFDWFFYVNGIESPIGSAEAEVRGGDRIWWDHRDWTDAMRVPAVVGSWPEPLLQASEGDPHEVGVECAAERSTCDQVEEKLDAADVDAAVVDPGGADDSAPRVVVGEWERIQDDPAAAQLDDGPATSGVFARIHGPGDGQRLTLLDERGAATGEVDSGGGLVAAVRDGDDPPTWLVTGIDAEGVAAAAELLDAETLAQRYAVATEGDGSAVPVPVLDGAG